MREAQLKCEGVVILYAIILDIARSEHVDGVLAYASDPAAPTAAYVAEKMDDYSDAPEAPVRIVGKHLSGLRDALRQHICGEAALELHSDDSP